MNGYMDGGLFVVSFSTSYSPIFESYLLVEKEKDIETKIQQRKNNRVSFAVK